MKKALFICMLAALVMVIAACGSNSTNSDKSPEQETGGVESTGSASQEVVIKATNWEFDKSEYVVKKGEPVKLTLESESGIHGIAISDLDVKLGNGDSTVITIDEAGEYEFRCNIQCGTGHSKMIAKLVVE